MLTVLPSLNMVHNSKAEFESRYGRHRKMP